MTLIKEDDEEGEEPTVDSSDVIHTMALSPTIITPRPCDILCGAGYETAQHHGNVVFRRIVNKHLDTYLAATCKKSKMKASRAILHEVFDTGARFLKKDSSRRPSGGWYVADIKVGKDKISHCLRLLKMSRINGSDNPEAMMHVPPTAVSERQPVVAPREKILSSSHLQSLTPNTGHDENNDHDHLAPPEQLYTASRCRPQHDPKTCQGELLQEKYSPITATTTSNNTRRVVDGEIANAPRSMRHVNHPKHGRDSWSTRPGAAESSFESTGQRLGLSPRRQSHQEQYYYYPEQRRSSSSSPPPKHRYWNYSNPNTASSSHCLEYGTGHWGEYGTGHRGNSTRRTEETTAVGGGMDYTEGGYWFNEEKANHSGWNNDDEDRRRMMVSYQQQPNRHGNDRTDNRTNSFTSRVTSDSSSRNEYPRGHPCYFLPVNGDTETVLEDYSEIVPKGPETTQSCMHEPYYRNSDDRITGPSRRRPGGATVGSGHDYLRLGEYYGGHHQRPPPAPHYYGSMYVYPPTFPPADHEVSLPLMVKGHGSGQVLYREDEVWAPPPPPGYPMLPSGDGVEYDYTTVSKTTFRKRSSYDRSEANHKLPRID